LFEPTPKAKAINQKNEGARKNEGAHVAIKLKSGRAMIEKEERGERGGWRKECGDVPE
jgi:hypothetical protein